MVAKASYYLLLDVFLRKMKTVDCPPIFIGIPLRRDFLSGLDSRNDYSNQEFFQCPYGHVGIVLEET